VLRRHFEVDGEFMVIAALYQLNLQGKLPAEEVVRAIRDLGVDSEQVDPLVA
jgi:pyruvate dehydrogenase E1 component